ncbi:flagellar protein G [Methanocaldococcus fervens]|uniref:Flagellin n=1 Tax=Methanocaldococcus fervens (strain DSM 4213 / JCM 15782 / AG86) TaxID=573064 RepID=C7P8Y5_METFA|nr:flagellar protein G [Methanocaldococcus fervens]ACV25017.1 flagellin [Methanocaldococcus fervens AG86]
MASSALSEIIMFVAVLLIAAFVAGILTTSTYKISVNIGKKGDELSTKLSQDFEIINDPGSIPRNSSAGITIIYIKNTGKDPIIFTDDSFTVIIDGNIVEISDTKQLSNPESNTLYPGDVGEIDVNYNETGYHKIKVVSDSGISRVIRGYIS